MVTRLLIPLMGIVFLAVVTMAQDPISPCMDIDNCDSCIDKDLECTACPGKALLVDGTGCNDCPSDCDECSDEGTNGSPDVKCTKCSQGFVLNAEKQCSACSTGCKYCNSTGESTVCHTCYEPNGAGKYFARNAEDGTCLECPSNCKKCTVQVTDGVATTVCSSCISAYALKSSDKTCKSCPTNCVTCFVNADDDTICTECNTVGIKKYVLDKTVDSNNCLECDCGDLSLCSGERRTASLSECTGCPDKKYLDTDFACMPCGDGCETCETSDTTCKSCKTGFYSSGTNTCSGCVTNCDVCMDASTCDTCRKEFGLTVSSLVCEACVDANCNSCPTNANTCEGCENGYYFDGTATTKCTRCDDNNCKTCSPADTCSECNSDWLLFNDACRQGDCNDPNCKTCNPKDTCSLCKDGFGLVNSVCTKCTVDNCMKCDDDASACDTGFCADKYGEVSGACTECTDTTNCLDCDTTVATCTRCISGWGLAGTTTCVECDDKANGCTRCDTDQATCDATFCESGKGLLGQTTCSPCGAVANCLNCDVAGECDVCAVGYYLMGTTCATCESVLDGCAECNAAGDDCTKCKPDLVMNMAGDACYTCSLTGCTACGSTAMCEVCETGYELKGDNTCGKCDVNCATDPDSCSLDGNGDVTCTQCKTGYVKNTDTGMCVACDPNCATTAGACTYTTADGVKCTTCADQYQANDEFKCDACPPGCKTCPYVDGKLTCNLCLATRFGNDDVCISCPTNCDECSETDGAMICSKCAEGNALDSSGNQCKPCPSNCKKCTYSGGNVICQDCKDGFGLSGNKQSCVACSSLAFANCAECTNANSAEEATCLSCAAGYTFKDDQKECRACSALTDCGVCQDKPFECLSCKSGFSETDDHLCAYLCYSCSGNAEECGTFAANTVGNITEPCFEGACWAYYDLRDGADPLHRRGCFNVTCEDANDASKERCNSTDCVQCCTGDRCNDWTLTGMDSGVDAITQTLAFILVTLAALGLLK